MTKQILSLDTTRPCWKSWSGADTSGTLKGLPSRLGEREFSGRNTNE
jgi:hypothetical protein